MSETPDQRRVSEGSAEPLGVTVAGSGLNVAVFSASAEQIFFCLFDETGTIEQQRIALPGRTGSVHHAWIDGLGLGTRYGLRASGPYAPHDGHRFNPAKLLLDPYTRALDRRFAMDTRLFGFEHGTGQPDPVDSAAVMPKAIVVAPTAATPWQGALPWDRLVIAELHVRGFTKRHPDIPEALRGTFAGLASPAAIVHLKGLGITTVELLPAMAGLDERHLKPLGLTNYWNYNPVAWMVPDPRLAPGGWDEVRLATAALNAAGIEVILDVVFNHSAEGDAEGPTVSLRGLDNASYYRLRPDNPAGYVDDAGCGNILACDRPWVVRLALDALRAWAEFGGINGFRFDLATTLARSSSGFNPGAPLLSAIEQDPVLRNLRLVAEPWDIGPGGYQVGAFGAQWGEWNDRYRDDVRRFWRGDGAIADLATRLAGSADLFWPKHRPSRSINFVTVHDGFTLADLVSYAHKHNEANGEGNRDGTNDNRSWNNGIEGPTTDPQIIEARRRDQRNLLATLFLSRGTPMLGPGAEMGATQGGNNNAYCQDNAMSWIDWSNHDPDLPGFVSSLAALRSRHPALHRDHFLSGADSESMHLPDVVWRLPNGAVPTPAQWHDPKTMTLVAVFSAPSTSPTVDRVLAIFHAGDSPETVTLPPCRAGHVWSIALDTTQARPEMTVQVSELNIEGRAVLLLAEIDRSLASDDT